MAFLWQGLCVRSLLRSLLARNTRRGVVFLLSTELARSVPVSPASSQLRRAGARGRPAAAGAGIGGVSGRPRRRGQRQVSRSPPATRPADHGPGAAPKRAAAAEQGAAAAGLGATRPDGRRDPQLRGSLLALRSIARRVLQLTVEERRARTRDRNAHLQARTPAPRPTWRWTALLHNSRSLLSEGGDSHPRPPVEPLVDR
jgi:hypothetical protein